MASVIGSNVERIKNILAGKHTDKTKTQVGFNRNHTTHKEGEVWEEQGKTWTIKNGLKQTVTKLDAARQALLMPWACPSCSKPLKHQIDKNAWKLTKKCFDCVTKEETSMIIDGTFDAHTKKIYKENAYAWLAEKRMQFDLFMSDTNNLRGFVTQAGDVEDWYGGVTQEQKKEIADKFEEEFNTIKKRIDDL